jgi:hypothetical protein
MRGVEECCVEKMFGVRWFYRKKRRCESRYWRLVEHQVLTAESNII